MLQVGGIGVLFVFFVILIWIWNSLYIIKEWERGVVLRLGGGAQLVVMSSVCGQNFQECGLLRRQTNRRAGIQNLLRRRREIGG